MKKKLILSRENVRYESPNPNDDIADLNQKDADFRYKVNQQTYNYYRKLASKYPLPRN
jgi:hypothetical protein